MSESINVVDEINKIKAEVEAIRATQKQILRLLSDTNNRLDDLIKRL